MSTSITPCPHGHEEAQAPPQMAFPGLELNSTLFTKLHRLCLVIAATL